MSAPELSVIVPLYNERENVAPLQREIASALQGYDYELILVDDGSTDGTRQAVTFDGRTRLLAFERNAGQSAAMYVGMHASRGRYVGMLDGDLQNDPIDLQLLMQEIMKGSDMVCGYRKKRRDTWVKRISSRIANGVRSRFIGDGIRDTGCSLKLMKRECVAALVPFYGMHRFMPALVKGAGFSIAEVPVNHRPRAAGVSKYGFGSRVFKATIDMFAVRWLLSRQLKYKLMPEKP